VLEDDIEEEHFMSKSSNIILIAKQCKYQHVYSLLKIVSVNVSAYVLFAKNYK